MRPFITAITATSLLVLAAILTGCSNGSSPEGSKTTGTQSTPNDRNTSQTTVESPSQSDSERSSAEDNPLAYDPNWVLFKQRFDKYENFSTGNDSNEN